MFFDRIGKYDFAKMRYPNASEKPDQPKEISGLPPHGWNVNFSDDDIISKINELVDAVNEMRKAK